MVLRIQDIPKPRIKGKSKRKGRGVGSGRGKTSGKGHKGAKARSGGGTYNPGFEGGQMPLIRRMPKRGFTNKFRKEWAIVNIGRLQLIESISDGSVVDRDLLLDNGVVRDKRIPIKVLGKGVLEKSLTVKAHAFSESARRSIEKAGGKVEVVPVRAAEMKSGQGQKKEEI